MITVKTYDIDTVIFLSILKGLEGYKVVNPLYVKFNWWKFDWESCVDMEYETDPNKRKEIIDMCKCSRLLK